MDNSGLGVVMMVGGGNVALTIDWPLNSSPFLYLVKAVLPCLNELINFPLDPSIFSLLLLFPVLRTILTGVGPWTNEPFERA